MHKISLAMETEKFTYAKYDAIALEMQSQSERDMKILHGKALLNEQAARLTFIQNPKRGRRSTEVHRSPQGRMVRRPDGGYTFTLRFQVGEKYLRETLISEVRNAVNTATNDNKLQTQNSKKDEDKRTESLSDESKQN